MKIISSPRMISTEVLDKLPNCGYCCMYFMDVNGEKKEVILYTWYDCRQCGLRSAYFDSENGLYVSEAAPSKRKA